MSSETDIANSALTRLGAESILDIADAGVETARVINGQYAISRDKLLRSYRWSFAMKRALLAAHADTPAWGFERQFELPVDYLHLDQMGEFFVGLSMSDYRNTDESEFSIEGRLLLCNEGAPLKIRYIRQVTEAGLFDPHFVDLLAIDLAGACCFRITKSLSLRESLKGDRKLAVMEAVRANAIEKPPQPLPDETWMIARI